MRVLLLHVPKRNQIWAGVPDVFNDRFAYIFPPLAVMCLSSYLKKHTNHDVHVVDGVVDNLDYSEIGVRAAAIAPDVEDVFSVTRIFDGLRSRWMTPR